LLIFEEGYHTTGLPLLTIVVQLASFKQIALYLPFVKQQFSVIGFGQRVGAFHFTFGLVPVLGEYGKPGGQVTPFLPIGDVQPDTDFAIFLTMPIEGLLR
jgi:hypothetical protein